MKNFVDKNFTKKPKEMVLTHMHSLHPYVKQRISVGENLGIFPKNMYRSSEVIDDVVLSIYENDISKDISLEELKIEMFKITNNKLVNLFENEKWHKKTISTKFILEEELALLEEKFTVDGGFDLIMDEELDDISYHQNDGKSHLLLSDEVQENVIDFLELKDKAFLKDSEKQDVFRKMYYKLPLQTSNVVDLYILGKLNLQEVSNILDIEIIEVKRIIDFVKDNFKKHLI
ncbi:MAG: hypothetical protein KAH67_08495 [Flavobacteriaceae bacterium]|nr:hypothetical protein [Flavobacteriaceae bacterium]